MKQAWSRKNMWDRLPPIIKKGLGPFLGIFPQEYFLGSRFRAKLEFIQKSQWWSKDQFQVYQLEQLRSICTRAYEKTSFYRNAFNAVGFDPRDLKSESDLARLPIIDKSTLQDHLQEMCTVPPNGQAIDYVSTGGTSGTPLHFFIGSDRSVIEYAFLVSSWQRIGYTLDKPMAVCRGRIVPESSNGLRHEYDPLFRYHYYSNFHMTDDNIKRYLDHIRTLKPCFLHVYPSSVAALARFILRSGCEPPKNILGIIAESEIVYPEQRRMCEKVFGCQYFSCYGHTEKLVLASECEYSDNYHVWPTYGYFELLDDQGRPVTTPGQRGEIVGTGFINTIVPFIRYRTGDYAVYVGDRCDQCGRAHTLIRDIMGHRIQETLFAGDGSEISWTALNMHDDTFAHVERFQFCQEVPGKAFLLVVPAQSFTEQNHLRILENLNKKLKGRIELTIQLVSSIPLSHRGKAIYVNQKVEGIPSASFSDVV
jgi:phenylacetate-CoA ligase